MSKNGRDFLNRARGAGTLGAGLERIERGKFMKAQLLTAFRAFAFAIGCFVLMALGGITVHSARDVALFVLGLAAFWVLIEKVFLNFRAKKAPKKY